MNSTRDDWSPFDDDEEPIPDEERPVEEGEDERPFVEAVEPEAVQEPLPEPEELCAFCTMPAADARGGKRMCRVHVLKYDLRQREFLDHAAAAAAATSPADPSPLFAAEDDGGEAVSKYHEKMAERWDMFVSTFGENDARLVHIRGKLESFMEPGTPLGMAMAASYMKWACRYPDEVGREFTYPCMCGLGYGWVPVETVDPAESRYRARVRPCTRCNADAYQHWFSDTETHAAQVQDRGAGVYATGVYTTVGREDW